MSDKGFWSHHLQRRITCAASRAADKLARSSQPEGFVFPQRCPPKGPPATSQAATRRCSKPSGSQTGAVLGTAAAPCTGTSRHAAGKGLGWPERACIAGFEITTCVSRSESLVPSPLHLSCSASQLGTLCTPRAAQTTSDPAKTPMW